MDYGETSFAAATGTEHTCSQLLCAVCYVIRELVALYTEAQGRVKPNSSGMQRD